MDIDRQKGSNPLARKTRRAWIPETPIWEDLVRPRRDRGPEAYARGLQLAEWNRKNRIKKRRAAIDKRILAKKGKSRHSPPGLLCREKMVLCMRPGEWFSAVDVRRAAGLAKSYLAAMSHDLLPKGYVERERSPGWTSRRSYWREPKWLYRLTRKGERYRELCLMLV